MSGGKWHQTLRGGRSEPPQPPPRCLSSAQNSAAVTRPNPGMHTRMHDIPDGEAALRTNSYGLPVAAPGRGLWVKCSQCLALRGCLAQSMCPRGRGRAPVYRNDITTHDSRGAKSGGVTTTFM
ncbi:hypothetical protein E2C01_008480 [Portunus trituberculatus]|uniref:Uncharacterized protein n=1 Tax=Portunus trituberculatus TaxID=210409 RepID=A0A5B7D391_PORTR|nr:hypothetical protein [Portunus trituberculatus]